MVKKYTQAQIWGTIVAVATVIAGGGTMLTQGSTPPPPDPNADVRECLSELKEAMRANTQAVGALQIKIDTLNINHRYTKEKVDSVSNRVDRLSRAIGQLGWRYGVDLALGRK